MGWCSLSFPFGSLLTAAKMTQVFSNFASLASQESGAPQFGGLGNIGVGSGFSIPGVGSLGGLNVTGHAQAGSGFAGPGVSSFDQLSVGSYGHVHAFSGVAAPAVSSFDTANVASGLNLRGFPTKQLLQRVNVQDATSRGSASAVFSTYLTASLGPLSSLSQILVRAGIYYDIQPNGTLVQLDSHLCRNPNVANSLTLLTNCSAINNAPGMGGAQGNALASDVTAGYIGFEAVDSATDVSAKQYGIQWARTVGGANASVTGGFVTIEEWL